MKVIFECPECGKEFIKNETHLTNSSIPVLCPHCEKPVLTPWKRLVFNKDKSALLE